MPQRKAKKRWERGRLARLAPPILSRRRRAIAGWGGGTPGGSATTPGSLYFQWWRGIRHVVLRRSGTAPCNKPTNRPACRRAVWRFSAMNSNRTDHIRLTSHPEPGGKPRFPIHWGAADPHARGPIIATVSQPQRRNVIGSHGGGSSLSHPLAVSA